MTPESSRRTGTLGDGRQFTLRQLFEVIACIALLLGGARMLWLWIQGARSAAERSVATGHCFKIVLALRILADTEPHLPYAVQRQDNTNPDSEALYSWRVLLLGVSGYEPLPDLASRWDGAANAAISASGGDLFCGTYDGSKVSSTRFLAITGPGTAFGDGTSPPLAVNELPADTILIVETRNSGLHWMEPGDFDIRTMPRTINAADGTGISGAPGHGFLVAFADSRAWRLSDDTPFDILARFFTVQGAEANDREKLLAEYRVQ